MAKFDVYTASVYFSDGTGSARRPILQLFDDLNTPYCFAMITTHRKRKNNKLGFRDVTLIDYKQANLKEPSVVRLSERIANVPPSRKYIGTLSREDKLRVIEALMKSHKIYPHKSESFDDSLDEYMVQLLEGSKI